MTFLVLQQLITIISPVTFCPDGPSAHLSLDQAAFLYRSIFIKGQGPLRFPLCNKKMKRKIKNSLKTDKKKHLNPFSQKPPKEPIEHLKKKENSDFNNFKIDRG